MHQRDNTAKECKSHCYFAKIPGKRDRNLMLLLIFFEKAS